MKLTFTLLTLCFALSAQVLPVVDATPGTQLCILNDSDETVGYNIQFREPLGSPTQPSFKAFGRQAALLGGLVPQAIACFTFAEPGTYWAVNVSPFGSPRIFVLTDKGVLRTQKPSAKRTLPWFELNADTEIVFVNTGETPVSVAAIYRERNGVEVFRSETIVGPYQQVRLRLDFERLRDLNGSVTLIDTLNLGTLVTAAHFAPKGIVY
jgi:hypothetical protein